MIKKTKLGKVKKKPRSGRTLEREVSKLFSLNYSNGERDDLFKPSSMSGGRATVRLKSGKTTAFQHGDICLNDPEGKLFLELFSVECKLGYMGQRKTDKGIVKTTWGPLDILDSDQKETTLETFWNQAVTNANKSNREPILCFRRNNRAMCITIDKTLYKKIVDWFYHPDEHMLKVYFKESYSLVIFNFKYFLKWINLKELCEYIQDEINQKEINTKRGTTTKRINKVVLHET